jgi:multiple sugar transport system ATP-binding protein
MLAQVASGLGDGRRTMTTVQLKGINKVYPDGFLAVPDLDLVIHEGEFFVLVGPSGCGKSTVLRVVAGLEAVTAGDVFIDNVRVNDVDARDRDIAMAFQNSALYPNMTVAENIGFPMVLAKVPKATIAKRVSEVAEVLNLSDVLDRYPGRLSGGQQQRVALGRAIIREPRLLLMDEPMSNLDAKLRAETRTVITAVQRRLGVTTLYVTHDQVEAMTMADRVAVISHGRVLQCGPPMELYDNPANIFVAQFLGSPQMNVVLATITSDDDILGLRLGSHTIRLDDAAIARFPGLRYRVGQTVALGLRPETLHESPGSSLTVSVTYIERVGERLHVYATLDAPGVTQSDAEVDIDGGRTSSVIVLMSAGSNVNLWQPLNLVFDLSQMHLFDPQTGETLAQTSAGRSSVSA